MNDIQSMIKRVRTAAKRLRDIDEALVTGTDQTVESILGDLEVLETSVEVLVVKVEQKLAGYVAENYRAGVWVQKFPALHRRVMSRVRRAEK